MSLPQHITPSISSRRGQAPYNFVPLPEAIFVPPGGPFTAHDWLDAERLHGFIDLEITTETELYTRCAYPPAEEGKDVQRSRPRQAFYHQGEEDHPVIPGSSLRGMIRSLVEILSYSRITRRSAPGKALRLCDERLVHRAVADQLTPTGEAYNRRFMKEIKPKSKQFYYPSPHVQAGYLEHDPTTGGWRIRPVVKLHGTSFVRVTLADLAKNELPELHQDLKEFFRKGGRWETLSVPGRPNLKNGILPVWIKPEPVKSYAHKAGIVLHYARGAELADAAKTGMVRGVLVYSGPIGSRHMHTAIYEPDLTAKPVSIPERMWEQFSEDRDQQRGIPCRKIRNAGDPLFYLLDGSNQLEFFGPTLFFRIPYPHCTGDYVPPDTVEADGPLDLAESIFGTVNGEREDAKPHSGAHKGRLQFDDAVLVSTPDGGSPFLEGQDGIRWPSVLSSPKPTSYQNYLVQIDPEGQKEKLMSYSAPPPNSGSRDDTTVLRGFKRYWHRGSAKEDLHFAPLTKHLKQYTVIRPVKPKVSFRGCVRFENLMPLELGALLAVLELPGGFRHHLGMGKPLGMGAVHIRAATILINPVARYQSLAAVGRFDQLAQDHKIEKAREDFRREIMAHHNAQAPESKRLPADARLWDIPRLQSLGYLLDWEHRPVRHKTAYIPDPKAFRSRQVLPTPAAVLDKPDSEPMAPPLPARPQAVPRPDLVKTAPILKILQILLNDANLSQRQRLEAIDETLLVQLDALNDEQRQAAWGMIRQAIGTNKKTHAPLEAIEQRLRRGRA